MDVRQLSALLAVAEHGTFSAAADALHTVQSNISSHIAHLERELGTALIDRGQGRLTEEGEAVAHRARRILAEFEAVKADVAALRNEVIGEVRLGLIATAARWLVPEIVSIMERRYPLAKLVIREGTSGQLEPQLLSGQLDIAVMLLPVTASEVTAQVLFEEDMLLVVDKDHELGDRTEVDLSELGDTPLLLPPAGTAPRIDLDSWAARAGVELQARAEIEGVRLTSSLVFDGLGPAILPATALPAAGQHEWHLVGVNGLPRRQVGLARSRRGYPSAPARATREVLIEVVATGAERHPGLHPVVA